MSFDIECSSFGKFPDPSKHSVITIGITCKIHKKQDFDHKVVFQLDSCDNLYDSDLYTFETEEMLLKAFDKFMNFYDPDVIMGYNVINFDIRYLLKRREVLRNMDLPFWGQLKESTYIRTSKLNSKIMGFRESFEYNIFGRMVLDLYNHMLSEKKLTSYKLNSVAYEFLNEQKEEVHHTMISVL